MFSAARKSRPINPHQPNLLEVSGTTLPLLSTVLAGFAVTTIVQLIAQTDANKALEDLLNTGLTLLCISIPFFLGAATFSVCGQSYNYLILTKEAKELLNFDGTIQSKPEKWENYLDASHTIWQKWHAMTVLFYYIGIILFIAGIDTLFLKYIGLPAFTIVLTVTIISIICVIVLYSLSKKIRNMP